MHGLRSRNLASPTRDSAWLRHAAALGAAWCLTFTLAAQTQFRVVPRAVLPTESNGSFKMAVGDVNGDGSPDLVFANMGSTPPGTQNGLFLNDGTGRFIDVTATHLPQVLNWTGAVALGDVDFDTDLDIVFGNQSADLQQLLLNDGTGKFTDASAQLPQVPLTVYAAKLVDIDFDVDLDLVTRGNIFRNNGFGVFTDITATHSPQGSIAPWGMAVADVDGDGDKDLMYGFSTAAVPMLWLNDGLGKFTDASASNLPQNVMVLRGDFPFGDVDGDGDLDVFLPAYGAQQQLWLNNGKGVFTDVTATHLPVYSGSEYESHFADIDEDGDLDIVVMGSYSPMRLYLNDGTGKFTDDSARLPNTTSRAVSGVIHDLDHDGDLDIWLGVWNGQDQLWTNFHRHLDVPVQPSVGNAFSIDTFAQPGYLVNPALSLNAFGVTQLQPRVNVPGLGSLGISPILSLPSIVIPANTGMGSLKISLPNDPKLSNVKFYLQSLVVPIGTPAGLSNLFPEQVK